MEKLDPKSVRIIWKDSNKGDACTTTTNLSTSGTGIREKFQSKFIPSKDEFDRVLQNINDPEDCINSKELIDTAAVSQDNDIVGECIIGEITRLFARCFVGAEMVGWRLDTPTGSAMRTIDKCVAKIIKNRTFTSMDTSYLLRYKINYIISVNEIKEDSKEAMRLISFVEYFISKFTLMGK